MSRGLKMFYAMALACGVLMIGTGESNLMAGEDHHRKLGSPNHSGKFIAPLHNQVKKIKRDIREDQAEIDSIRNELKLINADIDSLIAHVEALEAAALQPNLLWINHLGFLVDAHNRLSASFAANPFGGSSGLVVRAFQPVADQVIATGLQVPPGYNVTKVRLCYQLSNSANFITHIKVEQLTMASTGVEVLTDLADQISMSPLCVDSAPAALPINPANGPLRLNVGVTIADPDELIVIRAVGLYLEPAI
ncbi:MAG: hypothetical protein ND866_24190 [Pyrinomonadaceae bacterium]|nr:hypothetical protein [Pyrinomonadaceae bacterium]